jgi:hypothetical protein
MAGRNLLCAGADLLLPGIRRPLERLVLLLDLRFDRLGAVELLARGRIALLTPELRALGFQFRISAGRDVVDRRTRAAAWSMRSIALSGGSDP